jgi:multidrug efflux pump subunit AcrA (membrane-fusion protein)
MVVKKGAFSEELIEAGTLKAVRSVPIIAPVYSYRFGSLKITNIVEDGTEVEKDDILLVMDPSEVKKSILDSEQRMAIAVAEMEKLKATQQSEIADLEADLEIARISREISEINFAQSEFESDITKKEIKLRLDNAAVALERTKEQIENRKRIHQEDLLMRNLSIKQIQVVLDEANYTLNNLFVKSPTRGIAILESNWMSGLKWQIGDQPYSGTKLIELPDLTEMLAEININEVDVSKIQPGLKAYVTSDAYSDTSYAGEIISVANLAQNKDSRSNIKVFPVQIKIHGTTGKLLPGLTVSCKIIVKEFSDVLFIPLEALFREQEKEFVYMKKLSGFEKREVKTGISNSDYIIITEGLEEGDEVALTDPFINTAEEPDNSKPE